jgi:2-polyprenyl-6-methoxyphenol hydroxylase-like FAD-dependent oxidoreductase
MAMTYDVLVIGGGPGGATAALLLARAGWNVALAEKTAFPRSKVCGEFISATSLPLLREIGLDKEFLATAGPPVRRVGIFACDAMVTAAMPRARGPLCEWGHALGREHLDLMLLRAAAHSGAEVLQPCEVVELRQTGQGFVCTLATRQATKQLATRFVIAANGSWQPAPYQTSATPHRPSDLLAFKAHFRGSDLPADLMPLFAFPGGYGGMVQSDDGRVSLSCCIRRDTLQLCRQDRETRRAAAAVLQHIEVACLGVRRALGRANLDGAWLAAGPIRPGIRPCYADGIFRIGNAAGEAHPVVAEGIGMALQSAWLLCRHLIAGHAQDAAARRYQAEWKAAFVSRIHAAALFAYLAMQPSAVATVLPLLRAFPRILTFGARLSGKTMEIVTH